MRSSGGRPTTCSAAGCAPVSCGEGAIRCLAWHENALAGPAQRGPPALENRADCAPRRVLVPACRPVRHFSRTFPHLASLLILRARQPLARVPTLLPAKGPRIRCHATLADYPHAPAQNHPGSETVTAAVHAGASPRRPAQARRPRHCQHSRGASARPSRTAAGPLPTRPRPPGALAPQYAAIKPACTYTRPRLPPPCPARFPHATAHATPVRSRGRSREMNAKKRER